MPLSPNTDLVDLPLGTEITNPLQKEGITKLGDLLLSSQAGLLDIGQVGPKEIEVIEASLATHQLRLRDQESFWTRAIEVYGSPEKVALWPVVVHLFSWGSHRQQPGADKRQVAKQLKSAELLLIGDLLAVRRHEHQDLLKELVGELRAERLKGWLHGVGIYWM